MKRRPSGPQIGNALQASMVADSADPVEGEHPSQLSVPPELPTARQKSAPPLKSAS